MTDAAPNYSDVQIERILADAKTFAVVGASANTNRPSYFVMKYLQSKGYRVIPINPGLAGQTLLGEIVVGSLEACQSQIDVVDVFRNSQAALQITQDAIRHYERLQVKVIWMQLGVINWQAAEEAQAAGMEVIMNRCPKIEYGRLSGEIGWAGVNSGNLTAKRPQLAVGGVQDHRIKS